MTDRFVCKQLAHKLVRDIIAQAQGAGGTDCTCVIKMQQSPRPSASSPQEQEEEQFMLFSNRNGNPRWQPRALSAGVLSSRLSSVLSCLPIAIM